MLRRTFEVGIIVGVDFGAPQRARDQRRKIIAIAAHSTGWHSFRIDATGMNTRLLANDPPGWTAKELVNELTARPARVVGAFLCSDRSRGRRCGDACVCLLGDA